MTRSRRSSIESFIEETDVDVDLPGVRWNSSGRTVVDAAALEAHVASVEARIAEMAEDDLEVYASRADAELEIPGTSWADAYRQVDDRRKLARYIVDFQYEPFVEIRDERRARLAPRVF